MIIIIWHLPKKNKKLTSTFALSPHSLPNKSTINLSSINPGTVCLQLPTTCHGATNLKEIC